MKRIAAFVAALVLLVSIGAVVAQRADIYVERGTGYFLLYSQGEYVTGFGSTAPAIRSAFGVTGHAIPSGASFYRTDLAMWYTASGGSWALAPGLTIGTTTNDCATAGGVFFNLGGVVSCDADIAFGTDTLTTTKLIVTSAAFLGSNDVDVSLGLNMATNGGLRGNTNLTPDAPGLYTGTTSNSFHFAEYGDVAFDFNDGPCGTAACTDPNLIVHSHNQDTQEYISLSHDGTAGSIKAANSTAKSGEVYLGRSVGLTEAGGAETVLTVINANVGTYGLELHYSLTVTDGTNRATRKGRLQLVCDNAATVVTCTKDVTAQTDDASILVATGGATLTYAIAADVATANTAKITFDIDSSLVVIAATITWTAILNGPGTIS